MSPPAFICVAALANPGELMNAHRKLERTR